MATNRKAHRRRSRRTPFLAFVYSAIVGCETHPTLPAIEHVTESVILRPEVISPGQRFTVWTSLHNPTNGMVTLPIGSCVARIEVFREGVRQNWEGATGACRGSFSADQINLYPESYSGFGFGVTAGLSEGSDLVPAPAGEYELRVTGIVSRDELSLTFLVVE